MNRLIALTLFVVLMLVATTSFAQNLDSAKVYTFGCMKIAGIGNTDEFSFSRARIGADLFKVGQQARVEYDVSTSALNYAYLQINDLPGSIKLQVGQLSSPAAQIYPGPAKFQLPRWPLTFTGYSVAVKGVSALWEYKGFSGRIGAFTGPLTKKTEMAVVIFSSQLSGAGIAFESAVGPALFIANPSETKWLNYNGHFSWRNNQGNRASIQYYANPLSNLRFFTQVEKVRDISTQNPDITGTILGKNWIVMTGATLTHKAVMVKLYYDELNRSAVSEIAWSF
jgi:hypothetical protein